MSVQPLCSACSHPERRVIDARLANGESAASLAPRFELSEDVLQRHRTHMQARRRVFADDWHSIVDHLAELKEAAEQRLREEEDGRAASSLIRELREIDMAIVRVSEPHKGCLSESQWTETRDVIFSVLQRHPEVELEMAKALEAVKMKDSARAQGKKKFA